MTMEEIASADDVVSAPVATDNANDDKIPEVIDSSESSKDSDKEDDSSNNQNNLDGEECKHENTTEPDDKDFGKEGELSSVGLSDHNDSGKEEEASSDDEENGWVLTKIMALTELTGRGRPRKCSTEACGLHAAVVYAKKNEPTIIRNLCLDCLESDFGGWPSLPDIETKDLSDKHMEVMIEKCSKTAKTAIPFFRSKPSQSTSTVSDGPTEPAETEIVTKGADTLPVDSEQLQASKDEENLLPLLCDTENDSQREDRDIDACENGVKIELESDDNDKNDMDHVEILQSGNNDESDADAEKNLLGSTVNMLPSKEHESDSDSEKSNDDELWEVKKVMTLEELKDGRRSKKCSSDSCTLRAAVVYFNVNDPKEIWNACLDCQEADFGGWPKTSELPIKHMTEEHKSIMMAKCSKSNVVSMPSFDQNDEDEIGSPKSEGKEDAAETSLRESSTIDPSENSQNGISSDIITPGSNKDSTESEKKESEEKTESEAEDEAWDLVKIMSIAEVSSDCPIKCFMDDCPLPAAVTYMSSLPPNKKWYGCLDCQENEFGGWPEPHELPVKYISADHKAVLIAKCSKFKNVAMPDLPTNPPGTKFDEEPRESVTNVVSPCQAKVPLRENTGGEVPCGSVVVSPSTADISTRNKSTGPKPSKQMLETHRKWQEMAESMGGPGARIVVNKPDAKRLIYDKLYEAFRPMNITEIYKELQATVPNIVLKTCLDDMAIDKANSNQFADSDDEMDDGRKNKAKPREGNNYDLSLCFKAGKHTNNSLYYVDYNSALNGNGLDRDEKSTLESNVAKSGAERDSLQLTIKSIEVEITKLLSEPKNDEVDTLLEDEEVELAKAQDQLETVREFKVNEAHRKQLKRRIFTMTTEWRKRRRLCMDFLMLMEENTEGTVNARKCLMGDGQIDIDSDEVVAKNVLSLAKNKKSHPLGKKQVSKKGICKTKPLDCLADESFVAVLLDSQGCVSRVYADTEDH